MNVELTEVLATPSVQLSTELVISLEVLDSDFVLLTTCNHWIPFLSTSQALKKLCGSKNVDLVTFFVVTHSWSQYISFTFLQLVFIWRRGAEFKFETRRFCTVFFLNRCRIHFKKTMWPTSWKWTDDVILYRLKKSFTENRLA